MVLIPGVCWQVGDQNRGYLLELMLTKLRYAAGEGNLQSSSGECSGTSSGKTDPARGLQIVGMSATLPNVAAVADELRNILILNGWIKELLTLIMYFYILYILIFF